MFYPQPIIDSLTCATHPPGGAFYPYKRHFCTKAGEKIRKIN